jgi:hypothetical protein
MSTLKKCKLAVCVFACVTKEEYSKQVDKIIETWGIDADNNSVPIYFFLGEENNDKYNGEKFVYLKGVANDYLSASYKQWLGLKYIYENYDAEFVICCGTDTFINIPKLLKYLEKFDCNEKLYIGGKTRPIGINDKVYYWHSGGPGFVLSKKILEIFYPKLHNIMDTWISICNIDNVIKRYTLYPCCDVGMGYFANQEADAKLIRDDLAFVDCNHKNKKIKLSNVLSLHHMKSNDCDDYYKILKTNNYFL